MSIRFAATRIVASTRSGLRCHIRTVGTLRSLSPTVPRSKIKVPPAASFIHAQSRSASGAVNQGEKAAGSDGSEPPRVHEFQAETKQLLDIVAKSLYSEKEVFIRELISNASDAVEKTRYLRVSGEGIEKELAESDRELRICIDTDKLAGTITIRDNGIGMTEDQMMSNLGTIARSGSKAFMEKMAERKGGAADPESIIGRFGVGFYSAFMVSDKIEVVSRSSYPGSEAVHWESDGHGTYSVRRANDDEGAGFGTTVTVHLKKDCMEFSDENKVRDIVKKYSSFVGSDLLLNGNKCNDLRPVWLMDPKEVSQELHHDFYRYVGNTYDQPRFIHHFRSEAPMDIRALLYVPESRPGLFETGREGDAGVALYCRKILIKNKTENILPKWLRFVKGVVDSEDIPLNLSRELLQDSSQIRKLRQVITNKFLRFLGERAKKEPEQYRDFYKDYGFFLKEGIITSNDQLEKEEVAKLLRFESSSHPAGETVSIPEYCSRMRPGQRDVFYMAAPSRQLAESSPYFEAMKGKDIEVLFCYEPYDELVLMQLQKFDKKSMRSVEKEMREEGGKTEDTLKEGSLSSTEGAELCDWARAQLGGKAANVKITGKLESHPGVVTVEEMAAARHFVKTQGPNFTQEQRYNILQPQFEINPSHPIIKKLHQLKSSNPKLASLVTEQLFANAMVSAGLVDDPRTILSSFNDLLTEALEKH